jgi:hypothetical protein
MNKKLLGLGLGVALSTFGVIVAPAIAYADTTCYTGCSAPSNNVVTPPASPAVVAHSDPASGGLAFTGADIGEMAAIGGGALLVGGALVQRSRRQRRANA